MSNPKSPGRQIDIALVGVLNVTPDSFSDGGEYLDAHKALERAKELFAEGASVVDIGGEATNPWAKPITADEEWRRIEPIVRTLLPAYPDFSFSIDTRHHEIVERAAQHGRFYVNDVTTFIDPRLVDMTARLGLRAIVSHLPLAAEGDIGLAHKTFRMDSADQVRDELLAQKAKLVAAGLAPEYIILDPGIGFGKSMKLNWELLEFSKLVPGESVMIGFSRKRFLATDKTSGELIKGRDKADPSINLEAAHIAVAASNGPTWLRIHEPKLYTGLIRADG